MRIAFLILGLYAISMVGAKCISAEITLQNRVDYLGDMLFWSASYGSGSYFRPDPLSATGYFYGDSARNVPLAKSIVSDIFASDCLFQLVLKVGSPAINVTGLSAIQSVYESFFSRNFNSFVVGPKRIMERFSDGSVGVDVAWSMVVRDTVSGPYTEMFGVGYFIVNSSGKIQRFIGQRPRDMWISISGLK